MNITFQNIMPIPLSSFKHNQNSIWGKEITLNQGNRILLNASSGKGKSTFSNIIFGLRNDFDGRLIFDNTDTKSFSSQEWTNIRKNKISIVFQDLQLFPTLTVRENLIIKNNLQKIYSETELLDFLKLLGIEDKWNQKCGLLSMGQQQRVAIIRSLCQNFEWLILDEPFSHLDQENSLMAFELIEKRCKELNAGFVLTSLGEKYNFTYNQELSL
jgi:ABC-type lipoprotein export system ATPase subunit